MPEVVGVLVEVLVEASVEVLVGEVVPVEVLPGDVEVGVVDEVVELPGAVPVADQLVAAGADSVEGGHALVAVLGNRLDQHRVTPDGGLGRVA